MNDSANDKPYPYWKIARVIGGSISMLMGVFLIYISIVEFIAGDYPFKILPVIMGFVGAIYVFLGFILCFSGILEASSTGWVDRGVKS